MEAIDRPLDAVRREDVRGWFAQCCFHMTCPSPYRPFSGSSGENNRDTEGAMEVTMTDGEGSGGVAEVVLGVDTHLDVHLAVTLNELGRRMGELAVPTPTKGRNTRPLGGVFRPY